MCFIEGLTPDEANHVSNLQYVLRAINNIRQSTAIADFMPVANWYRQNFIKEGYESI